jgi:hypothetical protein
MNVVESDINQQKISLSNPNGIWLLQLPLSYKQCGIYHRLTKTLENLLLGSMATIVILSFVIFYKKREPHTTVSCHMYIACLG